MINIESEIEKVGVYEMAIKEENEITVRVTCSKEELLECLVNNEFKTGRTFSLDDYYFIPNNLDIKNMTTREIISKAVILRYIVNEGIVKQVITFKIMKL